MSSGEVQKRFDAHKSLGSIASVGSKPERSSAPSKETSENAKSKSDTGKQDTSKESSSSSSSKNSRRDRPLSSSETSAPTIIKPGQAPASVPRRTKPAGKVSRAKSTEGVNKHDKDKDKEKEKEKPSKGVPRSKSFGASSKREKSSRGERPISRTGSLRKIESDDNGEKKKETSGSKSKKDDIKDDNKSNKKKLDDKLGKKKSRKKGSGEDSSVASSVVKPKTSKVSVAEWDQIDERDKKSVTKKTDEKMSWFGFSAPETKDDSSFEGSFSAIDDSFSSIERDKENLDDSLSVMDLMNDKDGGDHSDDSGSRTSDDESSDDDSTDTSSSSSRGKDAGDNDERRADKDARERRKRAAELRKLQKKKKNEQNKKKTATRRASSGCRGSDQDRRRENPARRGGASGHRSEQFNGSMRNRPRGAGRGDMHNSTGPVRNNNSRPAQDPFGSVDQRGGSYFDDFSGSQHSFREAGGSRRDHCLERSRSFDNSTARYDDRGMAKTPRSRPVRTRSNDESAVISASRRGQRTTGGPYDDSSSRRERRALNGGDHYSDVDNSRRGRHTGDMDGSRRVLPVGGDLYDATLNGNRRGDMEGSRRGHRTAGAVPFDDQINGSRHGRRTGGGNVNDFNGSFNSSRHAGHTVGTGGGDPFYDWNNSKSGNAGLAPDPFGNDDPFSADAFDFGNGSQSSFNSSFNGNASSRGVRHRAARVQNVQNKALVTTLNSSHDQLAFVQAGKWMTEKERESNAPPKIQAWEKRRQKR